MAKRCCYALSQLILLKWCTQAVAVGMSVSWSVALSGFSLPLRSLGYIFLICTFQPIFSRGLTTLYEALSVRPSVGRSVSRSVGWSVEVIEL